MRWALQICCKIVTGWSCGICYTVDGRTGCFGRRLGVQLGQLGGRLPGVPDTLECG